MDVATQCHEICLKIWKATSGEVDISPAIEIAISDLQE
jgi:hypothetical protein